MRQVVLDTETTGLEPKQGHRIIEIGALELIDRQASGRQFHTYINPEREIDQGALEVHGITEEFLRDKPRFAEVSDDLLAFVDGAELVIHNAPFDIGFIDNELSLTGHEHSSIKVVATILDTLELARDLHPGQRNSLDALCFCAAFGASDHGEFLDKGGRSSNICDPHGAHIHAIIRRRRIDLGFEHGADFLGLTQERAQVAAADGALQRLHRRPFCRLPIVLYVDGRFHWILHFEFDRRGDVHGDIIHCQRPRCFDLIRGDTDVDDAGNGIQKRRNDE